MTAGGGADGLAVRCWTCDHSGRGFESHSGHLRNNLGQVVHTYVPLSPSSITWYWSNCGDVFSAGKVTAGLAESNDSLPPGDDLKSHLWAECLNSGISSGPKVHSRVLENCTLTLMTDGTELTSVASERLTVIWLMWHCQLACSTDMQQQRLGKHDCQQLTA